MGERDNLFHSMQRIRRLGGNYQLVTFGTGVRKRTVKIWASPSGYWWTWPLVSEYTIGHGPFSEYEVCEQDARVFCNLWTRPLPGSKEHSVEQWQEL